MWELTCCLDAPSSSISKIFDIPVETETKSRLDELRLAGYQGFVALGDNRIRRKLSQMLDSLGIAQPIIIHPSAVISRSARIGAGSIIMPGVVVGASCQIGEGVILNTASHIDHDGVVGDYCHVGPGCHLAGNVTIDEGAFLGVGTSVIPQVSVRKWSVTGAGTVVIRDIPEGEVWVGNPARCLRGKPNS